MDLAVLYEVSGSSHQEFGLSRAGTADHELRAVGVCNGCIPVLGPNLDLRGHSHTLPKGTDTSCRTAGVSWLGVD